MSKTANKLNELQTRLLRAIKLHSGMDEEQIRDAGEHGADGGWPGFTYYSDTVKFFKANRAHVVKLVEEMASDMGESPVDMVAGFQCLAGREMQRKYGHTHQYGSDDRRIAQGKRALLAEYQPSVSRCLYGGRLTDADNEVANALAWFALEEIGRALAND